MQPSIRLHVRRRVVSASIYQHHDACAGVHMAGVLYVATTLYNVFPHLGVSAVFLL
jgi:hypothetical protein